MKRHMRMLSLSTQNMQLYVLGAGTHQAMMKVSEQRVKSDLVSHFLAFLPFLAVFLAAFLAAGFLAAFFTVFLATFFGATFLAATMG